MSHTRRNYGQYCGLAKSLDLIGERWTLLIIRELLLGPRRYGDLLAALPGIGTNLLAERIKFLTAHGVLRKAMTADGRDGGYELTEQGWQLRQPVLELCRWGLMFLDAPEEEQEVRPHWGFLAVQAMMDPARPAEVDEAYEFRVDGVTFHIQITGGLPQAFEGPYEGSPAMVAVTDARTFVEIGSGHLTPFAAVASGRLNLTGDTEAIMRASTLLGLSPGTPVAREELSTAG